MEGDGEGVIFFLSFFLGISIHGEGREERVVMRCVGKKVTEYFFFLSFFSFG